MRTNICVGESLSYSPAAVCKCVYACVRTCDGTGGLRGIASVEELRRALLQCREAGKRTVFYTTSFGEGSSDLRLYYLASACQEVYISSAGNVGFTGITLRGFFLRDMLAKLGMEAEVYRRKGAFHTTVSLSLPHFFLSFCLLLSPLPLAPPVRHEGDGHVCRVVVCMCVLSHVVPPSVYSACHAVHSFDLGPSALS